MTLVKSSIFWIFQTFYCINVNILRRKTPAHYNRQLKIRCIVPKFSYLVCCIVCWADRSIGTANITHRECRILCARWLYACVSLMILPLLHSIQNIKWERYAKNYFSLSRSFAEIIRHIQFCIASPKVGFVSIIANNLTELIFVWEYVWQERNQSAQHPETDFYCTRVFVRFFCIHCARCFVRIYEII